MKINYILLTLIFLMLSSTGMSQIKSYKHSSNTDYLYIGIGHGNGEWGYYNGVNYKEQSLNSQQYLLGFRKSIISKFGISIELSSYNHDDLEDISTQIPGGDYEYNYTSEYRFLKELGFGILLNYGLGSERFSAIINAGISIHPVFTRSISNYDNGSTNKPVLINSGYKSGNQVSPLIGIDFCINRFVIGGKILLTDQRNQIIYFPSISLNIGYVLNKRINNKF